MYPTKSVLAEKVEMDKSIYPVKHDPAEAGGRERAMYPTKNNLPESVRLQVTTLLQSCLVDSIDLTLQAKQAHWNVKGPSFIALHELFDKVAEDAETYLDLIAERIVQLGGIAVGTLGPVEKRSNLPAYPVMDFQRERSMWRPGPTPWPISGNPSARPSAMWAK